MAFEVKKVSKLKGEDNTFVIYWYEAPTSESKKLDSYTLQLKEKVGKKWIVIGDISVNTGKQYVYKIKYDKTTKLRVVVKAKYKKLEDGTTPSSVSTTRFIYTLPAKQPEKVKPDKPNAPTITRSGTTLKVTATASGLGKNPQANTLRIRLYRKNSNSSGNTIVKTQDFSISKKGDKKSFSQASCYYDTAYYADCRVLNITSGDESNVSDYSSASTYTIKSVNPDEPYISTSLSGRTITVNVGMNSGATLGDPKADSFKVCLENSDGKITSKTSKFDSNKKCTFTFSSVSDDTYKIYAYAYCSSKTSIISGASDSDTIKVGTIDPDVCVAPVLTLSESTKVITATATVPSNLGSLPTADCIKFRFTWGESSTEYKETYKKFGSASSVSATIKGIDTEEYVCVCKAENYNKRNNSLYDVEWSDVSNKISLATVPPTAPSRPTSTREGNTITFTANKPSSVGKFPACDALRFLIYNKSDTEEPIQDTTVKWNSSGTASVKFTGTTGSTYICKVRAETYGSDVDQDDNPYSTNSLDTPLAPTSATDPQVYVSSTSSGGTATITWKSSSSNVDSYVVEYCQGKNYFGTNTAKIQKITTTTTTAVIPSLASDIYYFRIQVVANSLTSQYTKIYSFKIGSTPSAPDTYQDYNVCEIGTVTTLSWIHNCEDEGESDIISTLQYQVNSSAVQTLSNLSTTKHSFDTSTLMDGDTVSWRVKTKCFAESPYSGWKTFTVYAKPEVYLTVSGTKESGCYIEYPLTIYAQTTPVTQTPLLYNIKIIAQETYSDISADGRDIIVTPDTIVFDKDVQATSRNLSYTLTPSNVNLGNAEYKVVVTVVTAQGLTGTAERTIETNFGSSDYEITACTKLFDDSLALQITAWVYDAHTPSFDTDGEEIPYTYSDSDLSNNCTYSVYRRDYADNFILIADNINNTGNTWVIDPHPALKRSFYRIVATDTETGSMTAYDFMAQTDNENTDDVSGLNAHNIIIQWDEKWGNVTLDHESIDALIDKGVDNITYSGQILKLKYNIDISSKYEPESELVQYVGRKYPVSYYGTQMTDSATWNCAILYNDYDTLTKIRQLANYFGDVYVREPSGMGYWAKITVSISQEHGSGSIPVSFNIQRVEGGM